MKEMRKMSKEIKEKIEKINKSISELQNEFSELVKMVLEAKEVKITKNDLPEEVRNKVSIIDECDKIVVKPTAWLGHDDFSILAKFMKKYNAEWITDGKNSRFEIKK
jgi:hypothetical protein